MRILASYDRFIKRIVFADQTYVTASVTLRGPLFMVNLDSSLIGDLYLSRERVSKINCQQRPPEIPRGPKRSVWISRNLMIVYR